MSHFTFIGLSQKIPIGSYEKSLKDSTSSHRIYWQSIVNMSKTQVVFNKGTWKFDFNDRSQKVYCTFKNSVPYDYPITDDKASHYFLVCNPKTTSKKSQFFQSIKKCIQLTLRFDFRYFYNFELDYGQTYTFLRSFCVARYKLPSLLCSFCKVFGKRADNLVVVSSQLNES